MSYQDPWTNASNDRTLRQYNFKAKLDKLTRATKQSHTDKQTEFTQCFLIPDTKDQQAVDFLNAWLYEEPQFHKDDGSPKYPELLINIEGIWGAFRVGVERDNEIYHKGVHILVMSKYLEEKLEKYERDTEFRITALPASEDIKDENRPDELDTEKDVQRIGDAGIQV